MNLRYFPEHAENALLSEARQSMPVDDAISLPDLLQVVAGWDAY